MHIHVIHETKEPFRISQKVLRRIERAAQRVLKVSRNAEINIVISSAAKSRKLNAAYRKKLYVPDVLTFRYDDESHFLGELILVPGVIKKQAKERKHTQEIEFTILVIHGIVHMLGYEHENVSKAKKEAMKRLESRLLSILGLTLSDRNY